MIKTLFWLPRTVFQMSRAQSTGVFGDELSKMIAGLTAFKATVEAATEFRSVGGPVYSTLTPISSDRPQIANRGSGLSSYQLPAIFQSLLAKKHYPQCTCCPEDRTFRNFRSAISFANLCSLAPYFLACSLFSVSIFRRPQS
jgi:hypothetical protein